MSGRKVLDEIPVRRFAVDLEKVHNSKYTSLSHLQEKALEERQRQEGIIIDRAMNDARKNRKVEETVLLCCAIYDATNRKLTGIATYNLNTQETDTFVIEELMTDAEKHNMQHDKTYFYRNNYDLKEDDLEGYLKYLRWRYLQNKRGIMEDFVLNIKLDEEDLGLLLKNEYHYWIRDISISHEYILIPPIRPKATRGASDDEEEEDEPENPRKRPAATQLTPSSTHLSPTQVLEDLIMYDIDSERALRINDARQMGTLYVAYE